MRCLLDTHVFIWLADSPERVPEPLRESIRNAEQVFVSAASIWEMEIKRQSGKLRLEFNPMDAIEGMGFEALPVSVEHASAIGDVALSNADPFDRMLMAQAQVNGLTLVTADKHILAAGADYVISAL